MSQAAIPCTLMRGGTSKGLYVQPRDLPAAGPSRDAVLLALMGSPDLRQIDGLGGAHPLTSKIALVGASTRPDADVDYLFLQAVVGETRLDAGQNCGNLLAGVAPFAIEEGLVEAAEGLTSVRVHLVNSGGVATVVVQTPRRQVRYDGDQVIDGVPGAAAPVAISFEGVAGSSCGALFPTGRLRDDVEGLTVTVVDNGMPVVIVSAAALGVRGDEAPAELEARADVVAKVEALRLALGPRIGLGDVTKRTVPKICLVSPPRAGGRLGTRTFIPHRVHEAIGVLGALSVATAAAFPGTVAADVARGDEGGAGPIVVEHPTGGFAVDVEVDLTATTPTIRRAALLRTARPLMRGLAFLPANLVEAA